jgi:hypothetical protein
VRVGDEEGKVGRKSLKREKREGEGVGRGREGGDEGGRMRRKG